MNNEKGLSLKIKETIQYSLSGVALISGIVLCFISFLIKQYVDSTVLMYLGEILVFCAGVWHINLSVNTKLQQFESKIEEKIGKTKS